MARSLLTTAASSALLLLAVVCCFRARVGWGFRPLVAVPPPDVRRGRPSRSWQQQAQPDPTAPFRSRVPSKAPGLALRAEEDEESGGGSGSGSGSSASDGAKEEKKVADDLFETEGDKRAAVGNLVEDDEWMGLSMELGELVRVAVIEDLKRSARDFLGKDDYRVGDISKEIDSRVKEQVANFRGKDEYELGDFVLAMDEMSKQMTEELTGKPYEPGDLSRELDQRIKAAVAKFCGKDEYEFGDLTKEVTRRVRNRVEEFTGKPYEFGDVSRAVEARRREWVGEFLGEEAAENYEFGDITRKALSKFTGKDEYQFGDVTKKIFGDLFGPRKRAAGEDKE